MSGVGIENGRLIPIEDSIVKLDSSIISNVSNSSTLSHEEYIISADIISDNAITVFFISYILIKYSIFKPSSYIF